MGVSSEQLADWIPVAWNSWVPQHPIHRCRWLQSSVLHSLCCLHNCFVHCTETRCIWRVETPFYCFICSRSHNLALIQLFDKLPQLYFTVSFCQSSPLSHASNCIHERVRVELTSALYSFWEASCCASLMKLKLWLVISPVLLWFFSRKLILSLKATFSHEAAQGTPTMLLILLRAVYTPLRLGMNQCRHPCK